MEKQQIESTAEAPDEDPSVATIIKSILVMLWLMMSVAVFRVIMVHAGA